jgi:putative ABC transport system permease protein
LRQVRQLILRQGMMLAGIGLILGLAVVLVLARFLTSMLYGVSPNDPVTFVGISFLLAMVALLACYLPARRAARIDPMIALRDE